MSALMQTYARLPVTFSHGEGVYLYDTEGRRYLDGIAGIAVNGLAPVSAVAAPLPGVGVPAARRSRKPASDSSLTRPACGRGRTRS